MRQLFCIFGLIFFFSGNTFAQDSQYWGSQYGTAGFFLPGSVISYNGDSSVLFYNPALLANGIKPKISVSANIYYLQSIKIINGSGTGHNLNSTVGATNPQLIAGNFQIKINSKKINFAYGLLSSNIINFQASARRDEKFNVLRDDYSPGPEIFVGQFLSQNTVKEFTGVLGTGFKISKKLSAGIYMEGTSRTQVYQLNYIARAIPNPPASDTFALVSTDVNYFTSYNHFRMRFRGGIAWDGPKDHIGITIQSPSISVAGSALLASDNTINNIRTVYSPQLLDFLANTRQEKLKPIYKMPLSIALAYSRQMDRTLIYITGEYFASVTEYNIITPRDEFFLRPDTGSSNSLTQALLKLKDARRSVFNIGVGVSYQLTNPITAFFAFRSDNTFISRDKFFNAQGFVPYTSSWDIYHWQLGINLRGPKFNLRAGCYISHGSGNQYAQEINLDNPNEDNLFQGDVHDVKGKSFSAGIMLSYVHNL
jgi:hypothetical protein